MKKLLILAIILSMVCSLYGSNKKEHAQWWVYNYGDYTKTIKGKADPRVKSAFQVFERLKRSTSMTGTRMFIINKKGEPYALSLAGNSIIIGKNTLDICYTEVGKEEGNLRMAFILGHEIAHLTNGDFKHRDAYLALEEYGDRNARKILKKDFKRPENRKKEYLADKTGALYAAMAGYDTGKLFGEINNFLRHYAAQKGMGYAYDAQTRHPSFLKRVQFIRMQLKSVVNEIELFKAGVLLLQVENHHDAAAAFLEFAKKYPAREVYNNVGASYFNLAMRQIYLKYSENYYKFRLSTAIDYTTTAKALTPRSGMDYLRDKDIAGYLETAEEYFRKALTKGPQHRPTRCNLAALLIIKKEYSRAQAECDVILKNNPRNIDAMNNKAIAFYYYGKEVGLDTTQKAIQILENAHRLAPGNYEVLYNLAMFKKARERFAGARSSWEKYLKLKRVPWDHYYTYVCKKLKRQPTQETIGNLNPEKDSVKPPQAPEGIEPGAN
ncbi:MAG: hypothetical protein GY757_51815, partial [bacterium]|nr:hypothetical protein [bacterium]